MLQHRCSILSKHPMWTAAVSLVYLYEITCLPLQQSHQLAFSLNVWPAQIPLNSMSAQKCVHFVGVRNFPLNSRSCIQPKRLNAPRMTASAEELEIRSFYPPADRIVAIGDVHGDLEALKACLQIANLVDSENNWTGGQTHLVQVCAIPLDLIFSQ
jgi:hypothetical protein